MMVSYSEEKEKSLPMKDLQQLPTTSSGSRVNSPRFALGMPPEAERISCKPEMVGIQYGWAKIANPEFRWVTECRCYVEVECSDCGKRRWTDYYGLRRGKPKHCPECKKVPQWLRYRLKVAKHRCNNPNDPSYKNYGGRGIRFDFPSVQAAGMWIVRNLGIPKKGLELDRIDNNGDYAPGNIRFATKQTNVGNRRITVLSKFEQKYWPYSHQVVCKKLAQGMTREEIIEEAQRAVTEHRAGWKLIGARLDFMTYEMPDDIIVLPYRDTSSITVDTKAAPVH